MDIYLTYRGHIPSRSRDLKSVWEMRRHFHGQLERLWGKEPFDVLRDGYLNKITKRLDDQTFVPFYGEQTKVGVRLDIRLLTSLPKQQAVIQSGDFDNRIKRVIDALRCPSQKGELLSNLPPRSIWYCVMDGDSAVKEVSASLAPFLDSKDDRESFVFVRVGTTPISVTIDNLGPLF